MKLSQSSNICDSSVTIIIIITRFFIITRFSFNFYICACGILRDFYVFWKKKKWRHLTVMMVGCCGTIAMQLLGCSEWFLGDYLLAHPSLWYSGLIPSFSVILWDAFFFIICHVEIVRPVAWKRNSRPLHNKTHGLRYHSCLQHEPCWMNYVLNIILGFSTSNNDPIPWCGTVSCVIWAAGSNCFSVFDSFCYCFPCCRWWRNMESCMDQHASVSF